ncbi:MAG: hypothetical protein COU65_00895 [Candidatus Pacebacteria bacterium CG10_big_fil_rev_8_21_14_0_10_42_12]|nr:hypothetical protein [Candidatus Paceibacterota bacterium]PIR62917.1 MAG: hypothetical protein COU65_00895 [Candidatus Pacebacteria bacterium CG10_big_fil_rev_8_21_14_0_10_42_12]
MAKVFLVFLLRLVVLLVVGVLDRTFGFPLLLITFLFILTRHQTVFQSLFWITAGALFAALLYSISPTALVICGLAMVVGSKVLEERGWPVALILLVISGLSILIFGALGVNWVFSGALIFTSILQVILATLMIFVTTPLLRRRARWILTGIKQS